MDPTVNCQKTQYVTTAIIDKYSIQKDFDAQIYLMQQDQYGRRSNVRV